MNAYLSQILHTKNYTLLFAWWAVRSLIHSNISNISSDKPIWIFKGSYLEWAEKHPTI